MAIVGSVGTGKSTVLSGLLGEVAASPPGSVGICGHVVYCPQQAWVRSATVRDNILMGQPLRADTYKATVEACALQADLDILPSGDMTEVGERGVTLSGGQKQRIRWASAVCVSSVVLRLAAAHDDDRGRDGVKRSCSFVLLLLWTFVVVCCC